MAANNENPRSPEFTRQEIEAYTPSDESEASLAVFGRRQLRIINGQDPAVHPEKFTPLVSQRMVWPTNDEAYNWAEPGRKKRALFNIALQEEAVKKNQKTPSRAAGSCSSTPNTEETAAAASSSYAGPAVPCQL